MKRVLIENIVDKMILAKEVCGASGSVLLAKGTALTTAMGHRLKNWGVLFVHVEGEDSSPSQTEGIGLSPENVRQDLERKFSKVMGNELMKKLFTEVYTFKIQRNS